MSCELIAPGQQIIQPNQDWIFTLASVPCTRGLVQFNQGTGSVLLSGNTPNQSRTCCCRPNYAQYRVSFGGNIAVNTGGTAEEISIGIVIGGSVVPSTIMKVTPAAVEEFQNVSRDRIVNIFRNCCQSFAIRNLSTQAIIGEEGSVLIDLA